MSEITLVNGAAPSTPSAGRVAVYSDSADKHLKTIDDAGLIVDLTDTGASGAASGDLAGTYPAPSVAAMTTTTGPTSLTIGAIAIGETLRRIGSTIEGYTPAGGGNIDTAGTLWVAKDGSDPGTADRQDLPWLTIGAALAAASAGAVVLVRPGVYAESPGTVIDGVTLLSTGGVDVTSITGAAATGTRLTVAAGGRVEGFSVTLPTDALPAIACTHAAGVATVNLITFHGAGASGIGMRLSAAGKLICGEIRYGTGDCDVVVEGTAGILALDSMHVPGTAGAVAFGIRLSGGCRGQIIHPNMGAATVVTGIQVLDATLIAIGVNLFNMTNAIRISDNTADVRITGGLLEASTYNLLVDPALTGAGGVTRISVHMDPLFSIPSTWIDSDHAWTFFTKSDDSSDASAQLWGAPQVIGHPERGSGWSAGEGAAFSTLNEVRTTDGTASPSSDGAGFVDVSTAAESKTGSTFAFQALTAGHSIAWCTARTDSAGVQLKTWGVETLQTTAGAGGSYIWEIKEAAGTWTEVQVMAVSLAEQYRYADSVFLRASSEEVIHLGIDSSTTWAVTAVDGVSGYWVRVRIATTISTGPVFERLRLNPSVVGSNNRGQMSARGLALWRKTLFGAGNMWGEGGGAADYNVTVGSGVVADGETWSHKNKKGRINNSGDYCNVNYALPGGLCTAFPLKFRLLMSSTGAGNVDMRMSMLPVQCLNNLIADSGGGIVPIARTSADAYDANSAQVVDLATFSTVTDTVQAVTFDGFDISAFYEDDMIILRVGFDPGGSARDVDIWALIVEGVSFTAGKIL